MNAEDRMIEHADRLQAERDEWKRRALEEHAAVDAAEARIAALEASLREGIAAVEKYVAAYEGRLVGPEGPVGFTKPHGLSTRDAQFFTDHARALLGLTNQHVSALPTERAEE